MMKPNPGTPCALVGTADEEVYAQFVYIEGNTAEAAHGVYNQFLAVHLDEVGYLLEGIEHAGSGSAAPRQP